MPSKKYKINSLKADARFQADGVDEEDDEGPDVLSLAVASLLLRRMAISFFSASWRRASMSVLANTNALMPATINTDLHKSRHSSKEGIIAKSQILRNGLDRIFACCECQAYVRRRIKARPTNDDRRTNFYNTDRCAFPPCRQQEREGNGVDLAVRHHKNHSQTMQSSQAITYQAAAMYMGPLIVR